MLVFVDGFSEISSYIYNLIPKFTVMAQIDDQERFRRIQTSIFSEFDDELLSSALPKEDDTVERNILYYVLEQIKKRASKQLARIETACAFRIEFCSQDVAIASLQSMFETLRFLDVEFLEDYEERYRVLLDSRKLSDYETQKKN